MFIMTDSGALINLNNVQAITFRKAYAEENKAGVGKVLTWKKEYGYEVIAETDHKEYVIQTATDIPDVIRIVDELARGIQNVGGAPVIISPVAEEQIPYE